ncbi:protein iojap-related [Quercus suber]|uniref:Protein iojap-related n=1 Tax=Quercus suber TaxID=58331 RepID=A0AAW0LDL9_QUESU
MAAVSIERAMRDLTQEKDIKGLYHCIHLHLRATEQRASSKLMWAALRSRSSSLHPWKQGIAVPPGLNPTAFYSSSFTTATTNKAFLSLQEIEKVLNDVRADDVKVLSVPNVHADWADYVVLATGRSTWHAKQKQKGVDRKVLPSVEGQEEGKWIVIDSGKIIVHALDEKAREYYNLEGLWTTETSQKEPNLVNTEGTIPS